MTSSSPRKRPADTELEEEAPPAKVQVVTMEEIEALKTSGASTSVIVSNEMEIAKCLYIFLGFFTYLQISNHSFNFEPNSYCLSGIHSCSRQCKVQRKN